MRRHKLFWGSSYDRGIDILLRMWPKIRAKFPKATLDICYGWNLFDAGYANNPERMAWKKKVNKMMEESGIAHHGRLGKDELQKVRSRCGIWAYPTWFQEINCITALECQNDGLVPVTMNDFALSETVGAGVKIDGDINNKKTQDEYLQELLDLMGDNKRWQEESKKAKKFAKDYSWDNIANSWMEVFDGHSRN